MDDFVYFISDIHLDENCPDITARFKHFMRHLAPQAKQIYILGDLFEAWIGDDDLSPFNLEIINEIRKLTKSGLSIYFIRGNRDYVIGKRFSQLTGAKLLPDGTLIDLFGQRVLIMHGDSLCTLDTRHQRFRRIMLSRFAQAAVCYLPLWLRRRLARLLRKKSRQHQTHLPNHIMDVTPSEVKKVMQAMSVKLLIHGHTHRPQVHSITLGNQTVTRIVLNAWHEHGGMLRYNADGSYQLEIFTVPEAL